MAHDNNLDLDIKPAVYSDGVTDNQTERGEKIAHQMHDLNHHSLALDTLYEIYTFVLTSFHLR